MLTLHQLLKAAVDRNASDVHITAGSSPLLRVDGNVLRVKGDDLTIEASKQLCYSILTDYQKSKFENNKELDFSFGIKDLSRFRGNLFMQRGAVSGVFRRIPVEIPSFKDLNLPDILSDLSKYPNGLVLVTGPTGSGKTSTIAAMIDKINMDRQAHIVTLEDPIEYIYKNKNCIISQREIGSDTDNFQVALRQVLRQDPDVCVIGELRDRESVESALLIAETGHLVIGTLHTNSALQTINRLVSLFPSEKQEGIRVLLSFVLQGIVSQRLLTGTKGGVVPAIEILIVNNSIRNLIRENKIHQIYGMMQVGQDKSGMLTLNQSLLNLIVRRRVQLRDAFNESPDVNELEDMMKKVGI